MGVYVILFRAYLREREIILISRYETFHFPVFINPEQLYSFIIQTLKICIMHVMIIVIIIIIYVRRLFTFTVECNTP